VSKGGRPIGNIRKLAMAHGVSWKCAQRYRLDRPMSELALKCTLNELKRQKRSSWKPPKTKTVKRSELATPIVAVQREPYISRIDRMMILSQKITPKSTVNELELRRQSVC